MCKYTLGEISFTYELNFNIKKGSKISFTFFLFCDIIFTEGRNSKYMYKMFVYAQLYEIEKKDNLIPTDENKLVELSKGKLVFNKEYPYDEGKGFTAATMGQVEFNSNNKPREGCEFIPVMEVKVKEVNE